MEMNLVQTHALSKSSIAGSDLFFTVNLANRTNGILIKKIDSLSYAIRTTKA